MGSRYCLLGAVACWVACCVKSFQSAKEDPLGGSSRGEGPGGDTRRRRDVGKWEEPQEDSLNAWEVEVDGDKQFRNHDDDELAVDEMLNHKEVGGALSRCTAEDLAGGKVWIFDVGGTVRATEDGEGCRICRLFERFLKETDVEFGFLSNSIQSQRRIAEKISKIVNVEIENWRVQSAGVALAEFMKTHVPAGSRILCIGTQKTENSQPSASSSSSSSAKAADDLPGMIGQLVADAELVDTWNIRTSLGWNETLQWASEAVREETPVFVVLALGDGKFEIDFDKIMKTGLLLRNNGVLISAGSESSWRLPPSQTYPDVDYVVPTTGGIDALFRVSAEIFEDAPLSGVGNEKYFNLSKGGKHGGQHMADKILTQLATKGLSKARMAARHASQAKDVIIVGDDLGSDIKFGSQLKWRTVFVEGGVHRLKDVARWPVTPTCTVSSVGDLYSILYKEVDHQAGHVMHHP